MAQFTNFAALSYNGASNNSNVVTGELPEDLTITKDSLTPDYSPEGAVTFIVTLTNTPDADITGVTVTDDPGQYSTPTGTAVPLSYVEGSLKLIQDGVIQPSRQQRHPPGHHRNRITQTPSPDFGRGNYVNIRKGSPDSQQT